MHYPKDCPVFELTCNIGDGSVVGFRKGDLVQGEGRSYADSAALYLHCLPLDCPDYCKHENEANYPFLKEDLKPLTESAKQMMEIFLTPCSCCGCGSEEDFFDE